MKKSEPKMILNVQIDNQELEEKVKIATDKYAEQLVLKNLDDTIAKIIEKRIDKLINGKSWESDKKINNMSLEQFVKSKSEKTIEEFVEKNIKEVFAHKLAELL